MVFVLEGCYMYESPLASLTLSEPALNAMVLSPVVDGDFLPEDPVRLFHNAADIDYLAGVNSMDGHLFTSQDIPAIADKGNITV